MRQILFASMLLVCCAASVSAQTSAAAASPTAAYVYVGQNTSPEKVSAFRVTRSGAVSTVSGSPFTARSQHTAVSSGYLFGTDGKYITTYALTSTGGLHAASTIDGTAHNDIPSDSAVEWLTLDRSGRTLYAAESNFQGADNDAFAGFTVGSNGTLKFLFNSAIDVDYRGPLTFSQNNLFAYGTGCYFANWDVFGLKRASSGKLAGFNPAEAVPPNPTDAFLCPNAAAASAKGYLAVSYGAANVGSKQSVAIYRITASGGLDLVTNSEIATGFVFLGNLRFDPTGSYLAVVGEGIELFKLNSNGTLTKVGKTLDTSVRFNDVKWDNAGHVYAISAASLQVFTLHSTGLTQTAVRSLNKVGSLTVLPVK